MPGAHAGERAAEPVTALPYQPVKKSPDARRGGEVDVSLR
jgi:hypothetical protein